MLEWVPLMASWARRRSTAATTYRHRLAAPDSAAGALVLPDRAGRRVVSSPDGTAGVWDRSAGTLTVVARVAPSGFLLAGVGERDARVGAWGRLLAGLCRQDRIVRVQVLHRVTPGGGVGVRRWWADHAVPGASGWAAQVVADAVADTLRRTDRHESLLAVAVRRPRAARPVTGEIERTVTTVTDMLQAAQVPPAGWLTPVELRRAVRVAYDPDGAALDPLDPPDLDHRPGPVGVVGPMALEEAWDRLRTDSAWQAVFWVAQWPRTAVHADLLAPLLAAPGVHRSVSLTVEPVPTGRALRDVRRARVAHAADAVHRARVGRLDDESTLAEADDVTRRELDLVAGHGDLRFTGLVTVSAASAAELDDVCASVETAAAQSMCELRRLNGQHAAAHTVAALPLAGGFAR